MSRIVKSWNASVDENNRVSIDNTLQIQYQQPLPTGYEDEMMAEEAYAEPLPEIDLEAVHYEAELILANAEKKANDLSDEIIATARKQARQMEDDILNAARDEAEEIQEAAREAGYKEAIEAAQLEADGIIQEAQDIKQRGIEEKQAMIEALEPEMVEFMLEILDHLVGIEKETNAQAITTLVKTGLSRTNMSGKIKIHVSPADYPNVSKEDIFESLDTLVELELVEDPTIRKAGCIIETEMGNIDASLDTQYKGLRKNLQYILKNR